MPNYRYFFLDDKNFYHTRNKLRGNPRIIKFDPATFWLRGMTTPNPSFSTVEELIKRDKRFKQFRKERPSTASLIAKEENVINVKDMVFSSDSDNSQAGRMLLHLIEGNRKAKEFTGIHHLQYPLPQFIENFKIIDPPNKQGVYTASFEVREANGKKLTKKNTTTLFPKDWSLQQVYDECLYALNNKIRIEGTQSAYRSMTLSGIPVEIHFDKEEKVIRTLYPIRV